MNNHCHESRLRMCLSVFFVFAGSAVGLLSQEKWDPQRIRVESALVSVPVIVSDLRGRFVPGLSGESFRLYQDGIRQPIELFLTSEDPIKIALLLDTSKSTTTVLGEIKKAAARFLLRMRPQDSATVMSFDSSIRILCPFSSDRQELEEAIKSAKVGGGHTKIRDAISEVIQKRFRSISGRRAIVLLSDGQDHGSRISADELGDEIAASSTLIYAIHYRVDPRELMEVLFGVSSRLPSPSEADTNSFYSDWNERERQGAKFLRDIADLSAGRFYRSDASELDQVFGQISQELRQQYLLGFYPDKSKLDGKLHTLDVKVAVPDTVVRSRRSFRATDRVAIQ
jgi:Ca-activated chloride channel family protein